MTLSYLGTPEGATELKDLASGLGLKAVMSLDNLVTIEGDSEKVKSLLPLATRLDPDEVVYLYSKRPSESQAIQTALDSKPNTYRDSAVSIDYLSREVEVRGEKKDLSPTEFNLFGELARHPDEVLTRDHLLENVWNPSYIGRHEVLRINMWRLRKRIDTDPSEPPLIETSPGIGYMFISHP